MEAKQLFIPDKIKVGFQERQGTYTGKLAYVIYYDKKGVLRKATSWESWRDKKIEPVEHENKPTEGFVLNKGVGGVRQSSGWNARNEYIRVYDPRDFEFEISVSNLLFILREGDCSRGKGLEGKFVYAWDGTELALLPVSCSDYVNSQKYTHLQGQSVAAKDLIPGATYSTKKQKNLLYLGRFNYHFGVRVKPGYPCKGTGVEKKYVFWSEKKFQYLKDLKSIATCVLDTVSPDYAELVDKYNKSVHGSKVTRIYLEKKASDNIDSRLWHVEESPGVYIAWHTQGAEWPETGVIGAEAHGRFQLLNGVLYREHYQAWATAPGVRMARYTPQRYIGNQLPWHEPADQLLWAELESGSKFEVNLYPFVGPWY